MTRHVLIPGLLSDATVWQALADRLGPDAVVADVSRDGSIAGMATRALTGIHGDFVAIGHSMGGRVAMEMARQAPGRARALVLVSTGHNGGTEAEMPKRRARIALGHESMERLADDWLPPMVAPARRGDAALIGALRAMVLRFDAVTHERQIGALVGRPDAAAYLAQIACPILLLVGDEDGWSPEAQHREIAAMAPDAAVRVIAGAGHFLPLEKPSETVAAIAGWLAEKGFAMHPTGTPPDKGIAETPLFDREANLQGYKLNKMAMSLGTPDNRAAFKADEDAYLRRFGLDDATRAAVAARDWAEMVRLGGNLFFILKISAVDPFPITAIGAAQAGMTHEDFLKQRLGK